MEKGEKFKQKANGLTYESNGVCFNKTILGKTFYVTECTVSDGTKALVPISKLEDPLIYTRL
jgi:hypothetical protein